VVMGAMVWCVAVVSACPTAAAGVLARALRRPAAGSGERRRAAVVLTVCESVYTPAALPTPCRPPMTTGHLSTHVLDTMHGGPAAGMSVSLHRWQDGVPVLLKQWVLNDDGRPGGPLLAGPDLQPGRYRLLFEVGAYFRACGAALPQPAFLESVPLDFGIADAGAHYHVPLLCSPWSYSTYRGS
jgi:5-hydroxyisourate hydrolase